MQCPYCKQSMDDGSDKCPHCGRQINVELSDTSSVLNEYEGPLGTSRPALLWGLLASGFGMTGFFGILGIVFGIIGLNRTNRFRQYTGTLYGRAKAGMILSFVGIVLGAVTFTAVCVIFTLFWFKGCTR